MQESETQNPLQEYFKLDETLEFDKLVGEYVTKTGNSPFMNIEMADENGKLGLDMDTIFNKIVEEAFGDKLDDIISDYFLSVIEVMRKEMDQVIEK